MPHKNSLSESTERQRLCSESKSYNSKQISIPDSKTKETLSSEGPYVKFERA